MADTDTPPRKRATPPGDSPRLTVPEAKAPGQGIKTLEKKLATMLGGMALPFMAAGDMDCANLIASRAEPIAEAWSNLAAQSPPVRRALESMLRGGAWAGAIGTTLPVFVGVAAHHGMIPAQFAKPFEMVIFGPGEPEPTEDTTHSEPSASSNGATGTGPGSYPPPPFAGGDTPLA